MKVLVLFYADNWSGTRQYMGVFQSLEAAAYWLWKQQGHSQNLVSWYRALIEDGRYYRLETVEVLTLSQIQVP